MRVVDGWGSVLSAWVAGERNRFLGQELAEAEERVFADPVRQGNGRELDEWRQFKVFAPVLVGART